MLRKWLLCALISAGTMTILGLLRPWREFDGTAQNVLWISAVTIGALIWVLLPMITGWALLKRDKPPITRILLRIYVTGLLFVWGMGGIISLTDPTFDANLGLIFWPILEWIGLFCILGAWKVECFRRKH